MMKRFVVYDNAGDIIRFGISAVDDIQKQAGEGEKVMVVDELKNDFDLDNKVANPTSESPTIVKKSHRTGEEK